MKEKIEKWLDDYIEVQSKLCNLKYSGIEVDGKELGTCFSDSACSIHLYRCLKVIARELDLKVELVENYTEKNPYFYYAIYKGAKLYELSTQRWEDEKIGGSTY